MCSHFGKALKLKLTLKYESMASCGEQVGRPSQTNHSKNCCNTLQLSTPLGAYFFFTMKLHIHCQTEHQFFIFFSVENISKIETTLVFFTRVVEKTKNERIFSRKQSCCPSAWGLLWLSKFGKSDVARSPITFKRPPFSRSA